MSPVKKQTLLQSLTKKLPKELRRALVELGSRTGVGPSARATKTNRPRDDADYELAIYDAWSKAREQFTDRTSSPLEWRRAFNKLLSLPQERRKMYLANQPGLHTIPVATRLLRRSWKQRLVDPDSSEAFARLSLEVLDSVQSGMPRLLEDFRARAWASIGNARRIQSDFQDAEEALKRAQVHLRSGSRDPLEEALVEHCFGRLQQDQRRFREAIPRLQRAARRYQQVGDLQSQLHVLITLGCTYRESGEPGKGLEILRRAEKLQPEGHPSLVYVRHNQIDCLIDLSRFQEAANLLDESRPLYTLASEPLLRLRLPWIEGRIAMHTHRLDEAEHLFQEVRQGFVKHSIAFDAAQVSLELAEIYVQQGRNQELKELAEEMVTVFRSRNVERETLAALLMLQHAAAADRASLSVIRDIAARLRRQSPQALRSWSSEDS